MDDRYNQENQERWVPEAPAGANARARFWIVWAAVFAAVLAALAVLLPPFLRAGGFGKSRDVVVYCAQDQAYAEPLLRYFQRTRGVRIRAVFDSEAVKTVGLANRLLAEQANPQCDLFWGNEEMRTRQLARRGVFEPTNGWAAFGYRSRRIVINTNLVAPARGPRSLRDLARPEWRAKVALAYPQFGTTATHFHALRQLWPDDAWESWCRDLAANRPFLVDGNSVVVDLVGKGAAAVGLTDSDDVIAGLKKGYPLAALPLNAESLLIPNTVALVRNGPNPGRALLLYDHLRSPIVLEALVQAGALEGAPAPALREQTLKVDWDRLLDDLDRTTERLNAIFLRE